MSAHVLLNLLNELGKRDKMRGLYVTRASFGAASLEPRHIYKQRWRQAKCTQRLFILKKKTARLLISQCNRIIWYRKC